MSIQAEEQATSLLKHKIVMYAWLKINAKLLKTVTNTSFCTYLTVLGRLNCGDDVEDDGDGCADERPGIAGEGIRAGPGDRSDWSDLLRAKSTICRELAGPR
ncbi:hypothetical protein EVAR_19193_1 [Eumeta japonica]|uniref:Uncharacterized protein n=1 Tax=Eumeta variegata TaxID=151549 RepID=A0A4C1VGD8_EUMVA|nr:hypothetical protein EVAR_19193_1 [Eumeta japonica]